MDNLACTKQVLHLSTWFVSVKHHLLDYNKTNQLNHYMKYKKKCYLETVSIIIIIIILIICISSSSKG